MPLPISEGSRMFASLRAITPLSRREGLGESLDLRCILIVIQEPAELHGDDFLDEVVLVDVLEVAADVLHEGSNLFLIDVGLDYLVHHLVELLLADLLGRGNGSLLKSLANLSLNVADLVLLATVNDAEARTLLARTTGTSRAVRVVLYVVGQSVIDDVRQIIDIETTGSHVGSYQQLDRVLAELLHRQVALLLRQVAV